MGRAMKSNGEVAFKLPRRGGTGVRLRALGSGTAQTAPVVGWIPIADRWTEDDRSPSPGSSVAAPHTDRAAAERHTAEQRSHGISGRRNVRRIRAAATGCAISNKPRRLDLGDPALILRVLSGQPRNRGVDYSDTAYHWVSPLLVRLGVA